MKLSEELIYRGFKAETTIENPADLDSRENKKFYWGEGRFRKANDNCIGKQE